MPDILESMALMGPFEKLIEVFNTDVTAHGLYVSPSMVQVVNEDGSIEKSIVMNKDGTGTTTEGGVPGVPPGAPEAFVAMQEENTKLFTDAAKRSAATKCKFLNPISL